MDGTEGVPADGVDAAPAEVAAICQMSEPMTSAVVTAENPSQGGVVVPQASSAATFPMEQKPPPPVETSPAGLAVAAGLLSLAMPAKKKRGRPRNYAPDGSILLPLNPKPISASLQQGQYLAPAAFSKKRGRGPSSFFTKQQPRSEFESLGEMVACSAGANFTPHVINVASGEDVTMKIISFSQQGPQVICILSANGTISNVTLRQPNSSGGTLTFEGRFELLSLSGSFMPNEKGGPKSRSGGMSVSFASSDGRVVGGGVAGLLVAASPVQVVVGSFLPSYQLEQKTNKPKLETSVAIPAATAAQMFTLEIVDTNSSVQGQSFTSTPKPNLGTTSSFKAENWSASQHSSLPDTRNSTTDFNIFLPGG